ncbi:MAG: hypothetical protein HGA45_04115 [Chloroflexales bacterium]|nr:hypothetical protein [Chloroflexales bacterium]
MSMLPPAPLLLAKLTPPPLRRSPLSRDRLLALLDAGLEQPVTLVAAGAGFGKSTLVRHWLSERMKAEGGRMKAGSATNVSPSSLIPHPSSFAWLALDAGDNDPVRFWRYLSAAIEQIAPGVGEEAGALLSGLEPGAIEVVSALLLNHLQGCERSLVLVLDDYHVIEQPEIHSSLAYAIDHLPAQIHLVIISRSDPSLPLSRWRARGQLVEVRADALRFLPDEAQAFLTRLMGLDLAPEQLAALELRTEG